MTAPAATVIARRPAVGHVRIADIRCPWGHTHRVGVAGGGTATLWCPHGSGHYTVTIEEATA